MHVKYAPKPIYLSVTKLISFLVSLMIFIFFHIFAWTAPSSILQPKIALPYNHPQLSLHAAQALWSNLFNPYKVVTSSSEQIVWRHLLIWRGIFLFCFLFFKKCALLLFCNSENKNLLCFSINNELINHVCSHTQKQFVGIFIVLLEGEKIL